MSRALDVVIAEKVMGWDRVRYSTDIARAFEVVAKMRERGYWLKLVGPWSATETEWRAGFTEFETVDCGSSWVRGRATTPAEAICKAALASMGIEVLDGQ